jgi:glutathione S-transferase
MGEQFTVADGYLFTMSGWLADDGVDVGQFPKVRAHAQRVRARPAVSNVLAKQAA